MKNLKKYGCYTLLAAAVFTALWLMGVFIAIDYNMNNWHVVFRFLLVALWLVISILSIASIEETKNKKDSCS